MNGVFTQSVAQNDNQSQQIYDALHSADRLPQEKKAAASSLMATFELTHE
jgi:hypothetical protein